MRKHYLYITLSASLLAFTGCSNETDVAVSDAGKQQVVLTVGGDAKGTRAVVTNGVDKTLNAFEAPTDIWMVMQSDYVALANAELNFKGSQTTTNCVTMGTTGDKTGDYKKENVVNFTTANKRYWDDAHARSSQLSIWAIAVPNVTGDASKWGSKTAGSWNTTIESKTIDWSINAAQNETVVKNGDLCFSNNIVGGENRLKYGSNSKFEAGKLIFYHALTKITVILKEGDGFNKTSTSDFNLDNITLKGFKLNGTFDVAQGEFTSTGTVTPITSMYQKEKTAADMTLEALVIPGTDLNNDLIDAISFSLDGNAFKVSSATLKEKLSGTSFTKFEAGKNYVFTFTISKTGIKVTATIADWENVVGTNYSPLINFTQSYGATGTDFAKGFSLYLSQNAGDDASLDDNFALGSVVSYADSKYSLVTPLYWPNHQKHYLFRGVWPLVGAATDGTQTLSANVDAKKIAVANVAYAKDSYPSDLMLGYPRKNGEKCESHNKDVATKGICATEGSIAMNFQYVMSQVVVNLSTSGAANKVIFDERTTVEIIGGYSDGFILFKNGASDFTGKSTGDYGMNKEGSNVKFHDAVIPQSLEGLKFRITVTDNEGKSDKYETVLGIKEIDVVIGSNPATKISAWEPGKHYVYNLYITKTGIKVTATLTDWITVTASENVWF